LRKIGGVGLACGKTGDKLSKTVENLSISVENFFSFDENVGLPLKGNR
jgi:hypothetical protein